MIENLSKPTVLIDREKALYNIESMAAKAKQSGCDFRPHFKTHQSADIGGWFRQYGVEKIAVSSVDMAEYFAGHGWQDISICVPVNLRQTKRIEALTAITNLHLLVESPEAANHLATSLKNPVNLWIEIDTGYHRTGVGHTDINRISEILEIVMRKPNLQFQGILTHSGHTYRARSTAEIVAIYEDTLGKMVEVKHQVESLIEGHCAISIGDTPTCSVIDSFNSAIDEIRPGNFIFYDTMQALICSCAESEIALGVACPVIAKYPERDEFIIYGGAIHLSKEAIRLDNNVPSYGLVCKPTESGWGASISGVNVKELTQEHGKISAPRAMIESLQVGDMVVILPVHSCLTANLFRSLNTLDGERLECFRM